VDSSAPTTYIKKDIGDSAAMRDFTFSDGPFAFGSGMVVSHGHPPMEAFELPMERLLWYQRHLYWWIGDLFLLGERLYGDDIYQSIPDKFSIGLIQRCVAMSAKFPPELRNENLSWSHHQYVLVVKNAKIRKLLLAKAEAEGWDSSEFQKYLRGNWKKDMMQKLSEKSQENDTAGSVDTQTDSGPSDGADPG
jgi:hypothetical protein